MEEMLIDAILLTVEIAGCIKVFTRVDEKERVEIWVCYMILLSMFRKEILIFYSNIVQNQK